MGRKKIRTYTATGVQSILADHDPQKPTVQHSATIHAQEIGDGFHTMSELYQHRYALFVALLHALAGQRATWKAKKHRDGTMFDGCFVAGISSQQGRQITYHLPLEWWGKVHVPVLRRAPTYDGHTPADVIERLLEL